MERKMFVLGLKADDASGEDADNSDANFFSEDSDDGKLFFAQAIAMVPASKNVTSGASATKIDKFTDASTRISSVVAQFSEINTSQKKFSRVFIIPESPLTDELEHAIDAFIKCETETIEYDDDAYDMNVCCQIDIILKSKKPSVPLKFYEKAKLDPRVSSILYFLLADNTDKGVAAHYYIASLEEFIKFPSFAPVSSLYPEFSIKSIIEKLATTLCMLFPKHPILESVIHNLASIDTIAFAVLEGFKVKETGDGKDNDDDEMSDSFFESLKQIADKRSEAATLLTTFDDAPINPLASITNNTKIEKISVKHPPTTVTYLLNDGTDQMGLQPFSDWINSTKSTLKHTPSSAIIQQQTSHSYQSQPIFNIHNSISIDAPKVKDYDEKYFLGLFDLFNDPIQLLQSLPNGDATIFFPIYYPTLEFINSIRVSAAVKKCCPYPKLIECEYDAHVAFSTNNPSKAVQTLGPLLNMVTVADWPIYPVVPIKEKRQIPMVDEPNEQNLVVVLALANIGFIMDGRSPLTGEKLMENLTANQYKHPAAEKILRVSALYNLYKSNIYPPYISFKIAFALATGIVDSQPRLACDLIFEGMYILYSAFPQLRKTSVSRHAMLFLAETLEKTDRYYHAVMAFDYFFRNDISDSSHASEIAQIAHRNRDMVRAVFHYTECIKQLIKDNNSDQVLYLGRLIASVYIDNGLHMLAICLYAFLLKNTYKMTTSQRRPLSKQIDHSITASGTFRTPRTKQIQFTPKDEFCPAPNSINSCLNGCQCVDLLITCKLYSQASEMLNSIEANCGSLLLKMISFLRARLTIRQNLFIKFIKELPKIDNSKTRRTSCMSIDSGAAFDSMSALMKLLAKAYLDREYFRFSAFWAEMMIHYAPRNSFRDLGYGFFLRGLSFAVAFRKAKCDDSPFLMSTKLTSEMESHGHYIDPSRIYSLTELASEALSSLSFARSCFDRVGSIKKSLESSFAYLDFAISLFYDSDSDFSITFDTPELMTKCSESKPIEQAKNSITLTKNTVADEVTIVCTISEKNASKIMNPLYIIYSQILLSRLNILKGQKDTAIVYFDFAFNNLKKHFTCGPLFLPKTISINMTKKFTQIITLMCETLLSFDKDYINERLVLFDVFNNITFLLHHKFSNQTPDLKTPLTPNVDMNISILELNNPKLPDFCELLREVGILETKENEMEQTIRGYNAYLRILNANTHLYESQKLTQDEMHNRNKQICHKIEQIAESQRRQNQQLNPIDTSFSVALHHNGSMVRTIFIFRIFTKLVIYIPSTGVIKKIHLSTGSSVSSFSIKTNGKVYPFSAASNIVTPQFMEQTASYIFVDKKNHSLINQKASLDSMKLAQASIFGDLLKDENIFGVRVPLVPDSNTFGETSFFASNAHKGVLSTLAVGAPLIFYLGCNVSSLPLELMFYDSFVLRANSYTHLLMHKTPVSSFPTVIACRYEENASTMRNNGITRSVDLVNEMISSLGSCEFVLPSIINSGRTLPLPFPLFSSNKSNDEYASSYDFCKFITLQASAPPKGLTGASLFVFTTADLVELPQVIEEMMFDYPYSFFMFIPASVIRDAFAEMKLIFSRQKTRFAWVQQQFKEKKACSNDSHICTNGILFVGALQRTLMEKLNVPIILFSPMGQE